MWRARHLYRMVLRMTLFCALVGAVEGLALQALAPKSAGSLGLIRLYVIDRTLEGLFIGLIIGLLIALYTIIFGRRINNPHLFQFAIVIVTTIAALLLLQPPLNGFNTARVFYPFFRKLLVISVGKLIAIVLFSGSVAGKYIQEIAASGEAGKT